MRFHLVLATLIGLGAVSHPMAAPSTAARVSAFAALPDWRGIWQSPWWATTDASGTPPGGDLLQIVAHTKLMGRPPYNAAWEAKRQAELARMRAANGPPPAGKVCTVSFPGMMESPQTFQVVITPEETLIVADDGAVRHVYTDGRRHPRRDDLWPTPTGDSIGYWEGETLVIDTIAHTAGYAGPFPIPGTVELSADAHFAERLRQIDRNTLEDEMTIEDPGRFTRPWHLAATTTASR